MPRNAWLEQTLWMLAAAALALALSAGAAVSPPDDAPVLARAR